MNNGIHKYINKLPLFWRINIAICCLLLFVVGLVEGLFEPLAKILLADLYDGFQPWHEIVIWCISIVLPSLAGSYILSKAFTTKLESMASVTKAIANGNLQARFQVTGNDKDAFDVLGKNVNEMAIEIEQRLHAERRLLADISHELRSPLARMNVAVELLPRRLEPEERRALSQRLEKEISHMNDLVSLLLAQGRDNFLAKRQKRPLNLSDILQQLTDDYRFQSKMYNKDISSDIAPDLMVNGVPLLLNRIFANLFNNALFYTPRSIDITAKQCNGDISITVRDYGPGVPEKKLKEIFNAFFRVDDSRDRKSGGVGLGLALVKDAVTAHSGSISASNASPGLLVTVTLPALAPTP